MANFLKRFKTEVQASDGRIFDYQAKIAPTGDFKRIRDIDVIINSWNNILNTPRRSYLFDPEYGSDISKIVFEPIDDETVEQLKTEIVTRLEQYDDRATIQDVEITLLGNQKGFAVNLLVSYNGQTENRTVSISILGD